ncbi:MAG TPA: GWxTD domain-containing protein, partial [Bryobacteraceae bacterium]|nr:GWxTD domain-containing protein [Bryobacteraceae bacterium]
VATFLALAPWGPGGAGGRSAFPFAWSSLPPEGGLSGRYPLEMADVLPWLVPLWAAGVLLFYLRQAAHWAAAHGLRRRGVRPAPEHWQERLQVLARRLGVGRRTALLESWLAEVPAVVGHLRPVILVPAGLLTGLPPGQMESILLHELAHIRRYDYLVNALGAAVQGLFFYHPLVWWISGVMHAERENCCDDLAAAASGDRYEYARALAALEEGRQREAALAATGGSLANRIRRLLTGRQGPRCEWTPLFSAGILMVALAMGVSAWQANAPPAQTASPYAKWLNEDVVYIIQPEERAAFLRLRTDGEREQFIKQFWERRDPTPGTPRNEAMEEHYRRMAFANLHFPTAARTAGWRTDRGRIYIMFGPPDEIDAHADGDAGTPFPFQAWTYRHIDRVGNDVVMEFVDRTRSGDYRMTLDPHPSPGVPFVKP